MMPSKPLPRRQMLQIYSHEHGDEQRNVRRLPVRRSKMLMVRKSADRGHADHGWLRSNHSFSFAGYYDPRFMGWGNLRVINEDRVAPGKGFGTHGHRDMEIISYVLEGNLAHKDSMGHIEGLPPGDVQRMSAGTGVEHSEFNHASQETHFLQIWIEPDKKGIAPSYAQKTFADADKRGQLRLVVSPDGADGSISMNADARMYAGLLDGQDEASVALSPGRKSYVYVVRGDVSVNDTALHTGDAAYLDQETSVRLAQARDAEVLVFDLAA
jgi:redox-sensitive bicupin YhaK (pirin superfamily)